MAPGIRGIRLLNWRVGTAAGVVDFKYQSHEIYAGKKGIEGLPSVYVENENEADTLEVVLEDAFLKHVSYCHIASFRTVR